MGKPTPGMRLDTTSFIADRLSFTVPAHEGSGQQLQAYGMQFPDGMDLQYVDTVIGAVPTVIAGIGIPWISASQTNVAGRVQYPGDDADPVVSCFSGMGAVNLKLQNLPYFAADTPNSLTYAALFQPTSTAAGTFRLMDTSKGAPFGIYVNLGAPGVISISWKNASNANTGVTFPYTLGDYVLPLVTADGAGNAQIYNFGSLISGGNIATFNIPNTWVDGINAATYQCSPWGSCSGGGPDYQLTDFSLPGNFGACWVWKNRFFSAQDVAAFAADPFASYESGLQQLGSVNAFKNINSGAFAITG